LVVGHESWVRDDFKGREVAQLAVAVLAEAVHHGLHVFSGCPAPFDIRQTPSDPRMSSIGDVF